MELKYKGTFRRDFKTSNRIIVIAVHEAVMKIKQAKKISDIQNLIKLKKYKVHYRIRITDDYRIGVIIRGNTVWLARFGHRSNFYKKFP
mgnify:FL=1